MLHLPWREVLVRGRLVSTSLLDVEAVELGRLAAGRRVLELGSGFGFSAVVMGSAGAVSVHSVDHHRGLESLSVFLGNVTALGLGGVVAAVVGDARAVVAELGACGAVYDVVFVDGDHGREAVGWDVAAARGLLVSGGVLAVHDYGEDCCPDVAGVLDEVFPDGPDGLVGTLWVKTL